MTYIEPADADVARDMLRVAIEYLVCADGYSREQITELCESHIAECLEQ